jgi:hypothetical protein
MCPGLTDRYGLVLISLHTLKIAPARSLGVLSLASRLRDKREIVLVFVDCLCCCFGG